jgi:hypothetical protein
VVTYAAVRRNRNDAYSFRLCIENQTGGGMARGGRRAGAGRKASGKVAMLVRVSPKVRGAIEREAQRSGRSLSAQAEAILLEAALERSRGERKSRALAYLVTQAGKVMEAAARNEGAEFDWQTSRFDFEALQAAIMRLLERMGPQGTVERTRYTQYPTPADLGRTAAETVLAIATLDKARAHELAAWRNAPIGSPFYGLPQVAEDLGLG